MYLSTISGHEVQMEHMKIYAHTNLGDSAS